MSKLLIKSIVKSLKHKEKNRIIKINKSKNKLILIKNQLFYLHIVSFILL